MQLDLGSAARVRRIEVPPAGGLTSSVIATWRARMVNEYQSSYVFDSLADQLAAIGADPTEIRGFAAEEREHGALCGAVVESFGGRAFAEVATPRTVPQHGDTTPRAAVVRNVISICCIAETIAVALIGAERMEMPDGPLRDLLSKIWADEIGHARFGWRYLAHAMPVLDAHERAAVERYLPVALAAVEAHELAYIPADTRWPAAAVAYGLCDGSDARILVQETFAEVIVPRLEDHGLAAARAWNERTIR